MVMLKLQGGEEEGKEDRQVENWNIKTVTNLVPITLFLEKFPKPNPRVLCLSCR